LRSPEIVCVTGEWGTLTRKSRQGTHPITLSGRLRDQTISTPQHAQHSNSSPIIAMAPSRPRLAFTQTTLQGSFIKRPSSSVNNATASGDAHRISKKKPSAKSKPQPKSPNSTTSDRILTDVLLAIKPVHLANIASQQKNHEYRKYRLRDEVTRLWLYETGEGGKGRASITYVTPNLPPYSISSSGVY